MAFFNSAVNVLQTLVIALGAGLLFSPLMKYDRAKAAFAAPKPESQQPCKTGMLQLR